MRHIQGHEVTSDTFVLNEQVFNPDRVFVSKGWGYEDWIVNSEKYCGKLLFFKRGKKCSFHYHKIKTETFYVHKGELKVWWSDDDVHSDLMKNQMYPVDKKGQAITSDGEKLEIKQFSQHGIIVLEEGDTFQIPIGLRHMMEGVKDTWLFEFSTQHFDEDSYRVIKGN